MMTLLRVLEYHFNAYYFTKQSTALPQELRVLTVTEYNYRNYDLWLYKFSFCLLKK